MRYEVTYYYSVPKKKSPLGPILVIAFIAIAIAAGNDKKKTQPSPSDSIVDPTQLPVVTPHTPATHEPSSLASTPQTTTPKGSKSASDYRRPNYFDSDHLH